MPNGDLATVIERLQFLIYAQTSDRADFDAAAPNDGSAHEAMQEPIPLQASADTGSGGLQNRAAGAATASAESLEWLQPKLWVATLQDDLAKM